MIVFDLSKNKNKNTTSNYNLYLNFLISERNTNHLPYGYYNAHKRLENNLIFAKIYSYLIVPKAT